LPRRFLLIMDLEIKFRKIVGIFQKLLKRGPLWILLEIKNQYKHPTYRFAISLIPKVIRLERWFLGLFRKNEKSDEGYVIAVYDLNINPVTFDFAHFLVLAEIFSNKIGRKGVFVIIVPGKGCLEKNQAYSSIVDEDSIQWRIENIILPLINLFPACTGYTLLPDGTNVSDAVKGKLTYPENYDGKYIPSPDWSELFLVKSDFVGFRASPQGIKYIKLWKKNNKITGHIVTITLRSYGHDPRRNTNVDEWVKFAELIASEGFVPVFVLDTEVSFNHDPRLAPFIVFREPSWNLGLRMALIEEAYLNFFVSAGPVCLAVFSKKARCVVIVPLAEDSECATREFYENRGVRIGQRKYDFGEDFQVLSWKEDTFENIREEFNEFLATYPPSSV
jgi:hypothetical protein